MSTASTNEFPLSKESFERCRAKQDTLESAIAATLNRWSAENGSDTPDFILAAYLTDYLNAWNRAANWRAKWYSPEGVPADERDAGPQPPYGCAKAPELIPSPALGDLQPLPTVESEIVRRIGTVLGCHSGTPSPLILEREIMKAIEELKCP